MTASAAEAEGKSAKEISSSDGADVPRRSFAGRDGAGAICARGRPVSRRDGSDTRSRFSLLFLLIVSSPGGGDQQQHDQQRQDKARQQREHRMKRMGVEIAALVRPEM